MKTVLFALMLMAAFAAGMYTERFLAQMPASTKAAFINTIIAAPNHPSLRKSICLKKSA